MLHAHYTAWGLTLIVFMTSYFLMRAGKGKAQNVTHTILRILYILTVVSGMFLVFGYHFWGPSLVKMVVALWLLFSMEMILVRGVKGKTIWAFWLQFLFAFMLVFFYGYYVLHLYQL
ncbi:DUF1516 family protein [Guptibacillus hwajinpoensis]|uniref:Uncharacterized protein n=1 Tax=Guptibacillus hwajinpoensis TaxID=208199 RepID=A0A0J6D0V4_9BACL|nr:DUF1516 family protein [Alkalihalobacillus macyae]KMM38948.1 hypothetical protein AB986_06775 [Alkalihalobacillus macyae]